MFILGHQFGISGVILCVRVSDIPTNCTINDSDIRQNKSSESMVDQVDHYVTGQTCNFLNMKRWIVMTGLKSIKHVKTVVNT